MDTTNRIKQASKTMGAALAKLSKTDPEIARRLSDAIAAEIERIRAGK